MADPSMKTILRGGGARLVDVARYAQVSPATATRALANRQCVRPETRQRVLEAAHALSYEPNLLARGLRSGTTMSVGLIWSMASLSPGAQIMQEVSIGLQTAGYSTHLVNNLSDPKLTRRALAELAQRRVDGVIVSAASLLNDTEIRRQLRSFRAVVVTSNIVVHEEEYDCVYQNPEPAVRDMVRHFAATGRQRLAMLMADSPSNQARQRVFIDEAARQGCRISTIEVVRRRKGILESEDFKRTLSEQLTGPVDFDALFCVPDEGAIKAITHLRSLGYRIPEDIAVAGYNDCDFAEDMIPPLASVARHDDRLAALVVARMLARLQSDSDEPPQQYEIPMDFVVRQSAGIPQSAGIQRE